MYYYDRSGAEYPAGDAAQSYHITVVKMRGILKGGVFTLYGWTATGEKYVISQYETANELCEVQRRCAIKGANNQAFLLEESITNPKKPF